MTCRYVDPKEATQIISRYRAGQYTLRQLAEQYNLSKGTIINVLKGYPYNKSNNIDDSNLAMYDILKKMRLHHEQMAWKAFADGKMLVFGHHADCWEQLCNCIGDNTKNPWRVLAVKHNARGKATSIRFSCFGGEPDE